MITKIVFEDEENPGRRISVRRRGDDITVKASVDGAAITFSIHEWLLITEQLLGEGE